MLYFWNANPINAVQAARMFEDACYSRAIESADAAYLWRDRARHGEAGELAREVIAELTGGALEIIAEA